MKASDILFSILFLVLTVETLANCSLLVLKDSSDLFYFILVLLAALIMAITSGIDLRDLKEKKMKSKINTLISFSSSMIYILVTVFYFITNKIEIIV